MPSYTHLRRAQPVLVAHTCSCRTPRRSSATSIDSTMAIREADAMPLGSGAIAGTAYDIDVEWLAEQLGFSRVVANSIDASGDRDFVATFLYACAMAMVHLSRLAEDVIILSSEEFGFFEISDAVATGSSLMPQKKNPDPLELVRGKAGKAIGTLTGWLTTLKGLPFGYNKDLQEDKAIAFEAEDTPHRLRADDGHRRAHADAAARRSRGRPRRGCCSRPKWPTTSSVAALPFRTAHEVSGRIARDLYEAREGLLGAHARPTGAGTTSCSTTASSRPSRPRPPWRRG